MASSKAPADRPVGSKPDEQDGRDDKGDAEERAGVKPKDDDADERHTPPPGAVSPEDLTTETDDGAS